MKEFDIVLRENSISGNCLTKKRNRKFKMSSLEDSTDIRLASKNCTINFDKPKT